MTDNLIQEEVNRINSTEVLSEFEKDIRLEILAWSTTQPEKRPWRETVNAFWNERFN
jgi:hypothetical protein